MSKRDLIINAYRKLKQETYYDTVNLFLRSQIAEFEVNDSFEQKISVLLMNIESLEQKPIRDEIFPDEIRQWIDAIDFRILPKSIADKTTNDINNFISNDRTSDRYELQSANYFIEVPVELQILDVLWCMQVGLILDEELYENCLGYRLNHPEQEHDSDNPDQEKQSGLFKIYHRQYSKWRDQGIKNALFQLEQKNDILIVGLDIKQCFYHLHAEWKDIEEKIKEHEDIEEKTFYLNLTEILKQIHQKYNLKLETYIKFTHPNITNKIEGLPIALSSSSIIANWMLNELDETINDKLRPFYYGRYVDDILIVLKSPEKKVIDGGQNAIIEHLFENSRILEKYECQSIKDKVIYRVKEGKLKNLFIQEDKLIIQYFNHGHSHAGIKNFIRELESQASEFRFLPTGDESKGLDECAYDVIYKGSVNKLRSVIACEENSTELSKYLSRKVIQYRLCQDGIHKENLDQLFRFYKGRNIFDFCRLWEKVFSLLLTNECENEIVKFFRECRTTIKKLSVEKLSAPIEVQKKILSDSLYYLCLSLAMPLGLREEDYLKKFKEKFKISQEKDAYEDIIITRAKYFRFSNLIRHNLVAFPLINYTKYDGNLLKFDIELYLEHVNKGRKNGDTESSGKDKLSIEMVKEKYSPRYIHLDEYLLHEWLKLLCTGKILDSLRLYENFYDKQINLPKEIKANDPSPQKYSIEIKDEQKKEENALCFGIANFKVKAEDISKASNPAERPNQSYDRQSMLFDLINEAGKKPKCDLIVFPEVSIPVSWLPFMVQESRRRQIGIVFGLEYLIIKKTIFNIVATLLPFK
ncbi:MAG: reverse transcriptase domain-containing protein, partial [Promethearchaeota archaeon]